MNAINTTQVMTYNNGILTVHEGLILKHDGSVVMADSGEFVAFAIDGGAKGFFTECRRCGGEGRYSFNGKHSICYRCRGNRVETPITIEKAMARTKRRIARRERLVREQDERLNAYQTWCEENSEMVEKVKANSEHWNNRVADIALLLINSTDPVSTESVKWAYDFIVKYEKKDQERKTNATPVVEGKITVTGTIISTKYVDNNYSYSGEVLKMVVEDDRGFRVYGSVPRSIYMEADKGVRVTFSANVTKSDRDDTFGFFKRPVKAEVLPQD